LDWLTFISKLSDTLAWPLAAVILTMLLSDEVRNLLRYIKKLKAGPLEAEFDREVKELRQEAETQLPSISKTAFPSTIQQKLLQLAQINPRSAIIEAWQGIEFTADKIINEKALYVPPREAHSPFAVIRALNKAGILDPTALALYHDLRALRNQAAHLADFNPSQEAVLNYIELASRLQASLEQALKNDRTANN
jgi:hypothetical protein